MSDKRSPGTVFPLALAFAPAALLAVGCLSACGGEPRAHPGRATNVVVVLVDQLRKDAVGRWMPETHALGARGVRFEQMRAVAPWTYPSVVSMFSGLYPQQHGADGHPHTGGVLSTFDESLPLLPGLLAATHYRAAFVANPFFQDWNPLHRAFDHYAIDEFVGDQGPLRGFPEAVWTRNMYADTVNAAIVRHFGNRPLGRPEFVYIHYIDVHGGALSKDAPGGPWASAPFKARRNIYAGYADAARYVDGKIRQMYDYFLARYDGELLFVVTSDHGQELPGDLEAGEGPGLRRRKGSVHDFNIRIPFLIFPSAIVTQQRVIETPVANIDLLPTVLDWVGMKPPRRIPGRSLLPLIREGDGTLPSDRALYARMSAFERQNDCVVVGGMKYLRYLDPVSGRIERRAVFDLSNDPRETIIVESELGAVDELVRGPAGTHGIEYPQRFSAPRQDVLERLEALGYFVHEGR